MLTFASLLFLRYEGEMKVNYGFQQYEKLIINVADILYQIPVAEIEKIFSKGGITTIQFADSSEISIVKNLIYFENELEDLGFVRISRNVIVNCAHISSVNFRNRELRLNNDEIIPVSRRNISKLRKAITTPPPTHTIAKKTAKMTAYAKNLTANKMKCYISSNFQNPYLFLQ